MSPRRYSRVNRSATADRALIRPYRPPEYSRVNTAAGPPAGQGRQQDHHEAPVTGASAFMGRQNVRLQPIGWRRAAMIVLSQ
jgi:hypothetical protein